MRRAYAPFLTLFVLYILLLIASTGPVEANGQEKVTICHAAGLAGTTQYVTITAAYPAIYGQAGHFYENGTTRAGHEQDYVGACTVATATPDPTGSIPSIPPGKTPVPTPSETVGPSPTVVVNETPSPIPSDQVFERPVVSPAPELPNTSMGIEDERDIDGVSFGVAIILLSALMVWALRRDAA